MQMCNPQNNAQTAKSNEVKLMKKINNKKLVAFLAPVEDVDELDIIAQYKRISRSELLRQCIRETIDNEVLFE